MEKTPVVSVVMPAYNAEQFIEKSIISILGQTFKNFEFIIVDDASTDRTFGIISSFKDERLKPHRLEHNRGFIVALEEGVNKATGKWIARMDADDISFLNRLEKQLAFLDSHPECLFIGSTYHFINPAGKLLLRKNTPARGWKYISKEMLTFDQRYFADPSSIFLREAALEVGLYDYDFPFENPLWYKLLDIGKGAELYEPLLLYRKHLKSNTNKPRKVPREKMYWGAKLRYDPENAKTLQSYNEKGSNDSQTIRAGNIISVMRMCHVTGDKKTAWKIFKEIQAELGLSPTLMRIFIKGVLGIKNLSPFTPRNPEKYEEIKLNWYEKMLENQTNFNK